jgi:hypothetical protein
MPFGRVTGVDGLTVFGAFSVSVMLLCYALEPRSSWYVLGFAVACLASASYGFLQGAWPFGVVEAAWCVVALRRWWHRRSDALSKVATAASAEGGRERW